MSKYRRLTQHKRFVPDGTHPCLPSAQAGNFCFAKTSFMLETLGAIAEG